MISSKRASNAAGGKTARACDSCVKKRARWYCAADDAFLCQVCDSSVHSANSLARRHERVRLKTSSASLLKPAVDSSDGKALLENSSPPWHRGLTRKARTPRNGKSAIRHHKSSKSKQMSANPFSLVPEFGGDETSHEENEEQLLYRVPIFDPFVTGSDGIESKGNFISAIPNENNNNCSGSHEGENLHGFLLPGEMDLEEFAADVESLLGRGLENECFGMEELGLVDCKEKETTSESCLGSGKVVKIEAAMGLQGESEIDMMREPFELNFEDYDSPASCDDEDGKLEVGLENRSGENDVDVKNSKKRKILLKLDYEAVITAWASQRSPWTTGDRPELDADDCWPDCLVSYNYLSFLSIFETRFYFNIPAFFFFLFCRYN